MKRSLLSSLSEPHDFLTYVRQWTPLATLVGFTTGILMAAFYLVFLAIQWIASFFPLPLTMLIGGAVSALVVYSRGEKLKGSGVSPYISARKGKTELTLVDAGAKAIAATTATGAGCIAGEEGPAVFIGGSIALFFSDLLHFNPKKKRVTVTIGGAAATSAIFQTPLGGAIFATELPYRHDLDAPEYTPAFLASLISYFTFRLVMYLLGYDPRVISLHVKTPMVSMFHLSSAVVVGLVTGGVGILFVKVHLFIRSQFEKHFSAIRSILVGVSISAGLSALFLVFNPHVPFGGPGFRLLNYLEGNSSIDVHHLVFFVLFTILINSFTVGSGVSAGVFGPALVIGGSTGAIIGLLLDPANVSGFIIIGMSAGHTATTKTPIASLVLILELSGFPPLFLAMSIANIVAFFVSGESSIYVGQSRDRFEELVSALDELDILAELTVKDIMTTEVLTLKPQMPVLVAKNFFVEIGKHTLPVVNEKRKVIGVLTIDDLKEIKDDSLPITEVMKSPIVLSPDYSLKDALYFFEDHDIERAPVVGPDNELVGFITMRDIIRTHRKYRAEHYY